MTLKLEVGKSYRNLIGNRVDINCTVFDSRFPFSSTNGGLYDINGKACTRFFGHDLISEWEEQKYKAGDLVTIRLDDWQAENINNNSKTEIYTVEIQRHEPAPEPVSVWVNYYPDSNLWTSPVLSLQNSQAFDFPEEGVIIKLTFDPSTKQATATVIE